MGTWAFGIGLPASPPVYVHGPRFARLVVPELDLIRPGPQDEQVAAAVLGERKPVTVTQVTIFALRRLR